MNLKLIITAAILVIPSMINNGIAQSNSKAPAPFISLTPAPGSNTADPAQKPAAPPSDTKNGQPVATPPGQSGVTTTPATPGKPGTPTAQDTSNTGATPGTTNAAEHKNPYLDDKLIVIGTGSVTGVYYPAGGAICRLINKERKHLGIRCAVESTPGSIYNLTALNNSEIDFAIVQSDWQEHAYNGTGLFAKQGKIEDLRFVFSLHNEALTIVVQKKSNIQKLDDLKGMVVNVGPEGSGAKATMEDLMKAKGWTKQDFKSLAEYKPNEQAKALCDGRVDAMVVATGHPSGIIQEVTSLCETRIVEVNDDVVQKFIASNPQLAKTTIPGGMYVGIPNDVLTFGVKATLVSTTNASSDIVYNLTKTIFDNLTAFKTLHPVFQQLDEQKMVTEGKIAPYHDGAQRYYKEKGWAQ